MEESILKAYVTGAQIPCHVSRLCRFDDCQALTILRLLNVEPSNSGVSFYENNILGKALQRGSELRRWIESYPLTKEEAELNDKLSNYKVQAPDRNGWFFNKQYDILDIYGVSDRVTLSSGTNAVINEYKSTSRPEDYMNWEGFIQSHYFQTRLYCWISEDPLRREGYRLGAQHNIYYIDSRDGTAGQCPTCHQLLPPKHPYYYPRDIPKILNPIVETLRGRREPSFCADKKRCAARADTARIASYIVVGIGFIGAGTIIQSRDRVIGITTAASLWISMAVGIAIGTGYYLAGIIATILSFVILRFGKLEKKG